MVIAPDGGFHGTIGGGELEWRAIGAARDALSRNVPAATLDRFTLGPDLGQCCGGSVRLLTEVFERDRLDEIRALAAREAAGPFVTRGRIGQRAVERVIIDGAGYERSEAHEAFGSGNTGRRLPAAADTVRSTVAEHGPGLPGQGQRQRAREAAGVSRSITVEHVIRSATAAGPAHAKRTISGVVPYEGLPVEIEDDGAIIERFRDPRHPLWLFGAGHVGRALMLALAPLPFDVTWIDEREDVFPTVVPASVRPLRSADPAGELAHAPDGAFVVVMTHNHPLDLAIVHAALAAPSPRAMWLPDATTPPGAAAPFGTVPPRRAAGRFGYVGLIGSASKRARFARRLREAGIAPARVETLVCPIGMTTIRSKHPAAIAAGIVAQLLERADG